MTFYHINFAHLLVLNYDDTAWTTVSGGGEVKNNVKSLEWTEAVTFLQW